MMKCKWAGDPADEYCKNCDGIKMMVEGLEKSCEECNGYEEEDESVDDNFINKPEPEEKEPDKPAKSAKKPIKKDEVVNNTSDEKKPVKNENTAVEKVSEDKHIEETTIGIKVTSLRYTSSATVKKGDNYYKFTAEEEWSTELYKGDIQDVREQLWAKLNGEVDKQIEDLTNM